VLMAPRIARVATGLEFPRWDHQCPFSKVSRAQMVYVRSFLKRTLRRPWTGRQILFGTPVRFKPWRHTHQGINYAISKTSNQKPWRWAHWTGRFSQISPTNRDLPVFHDTTRPMPGPVIPGRPEKQLKRAAVKNRMQKKSFAIACVHYLWSPNASLFLAVVF